MKPRIHLFLFNPRSRGCHRAAHCNAALGAKPTPTRALSVSALSKATLPSSGPMYRVGRKLRSTHLFSKASRSPPVTGSFAEIQFENGGAIRLGEQSLMEFTELARDPSGSTINRVELRQGYATFHPLPSRLGESLQVGTPLAHSPLRGAPSFVWIWNRAWSASK